MNNEFIYNRKSIRSFKDIQVPIEDINEMIKAATYAPSGKNIQNWHFVIVRNKEKIVAMSEAIIHKAEELTKNIDKEEAKKFNKMLNTFLIVSSFC